MRKYAIWGTSTSPSHEAWVRRGRRRSSSADGFERVDDHRRRRLRPQHVRRATIRRRSGAVARHVLGLVLRARRGAGRRAQGRATRCSSARSRTSSSSTCPGEGVWFTTMERGTYKISDDPAEVFERLAPLAKSKLVIDNEFVPDLEPELWDGDEITADIGAAGKRMGELDLLPAPVPGARVPERARPPPRDAALLRSAASRTATSPRARTRRGSG